MHTNACTQTHTQAHKNARRTHAHTHTHTLHSCIYTCALTYTNKECVLEPPVADEHKQQKPKFLHDRRLARKRMKTLRREKGAAAGIETPPSSNYISGRRHARARACLCVRGRVRVRSLGFLVGTTGSTRQLVRTADWRDAGDAKTEEVNDIFPGIQSPSAPFLEKPSRAFFFCFFFYCVTSFCFFRMPLFRCILRDLILISETLLSTCA